MNDRARSARPRPAAAVLAALGALLVAVAVGVTGGLAARGLMRGFALALGHEPSPVSPAATAGIATVFAVAAIPGSVAAALGGRRAGIVLATVFGLALGLLGVSIGIQDGATDLSTGPAPVLGAVLAVAFVAVIAGQQVLAYRLARRLGARVRGRATASHGPSVPAGAR